MAKRQINERERIGAIIRTIRFRCYNPKSDMYYNYGARGIKVCDEWLNSTKSFYEWAISSGYKKGLQIDRINNNGNYEPSNCRWVTNRINALNKQNTIFYDGIPLKIICEIKGVSYKFIHYLIKRGVDIKTALETKSNGKPKDRVKLFYDGLSLKDYCRKEGIKYHAVYYKINKGLSIEEAINTSIKQIL